MWEHMLGLIKAEDPHAEDWLRRRCRGVLRYPLPTGEKRVFRMQYKGDLRTAKHTRAPIERALRTVRPATKELEFIWAGNDNVGGKE